MGDIIPFPGHADARARQLDTLITSSIAAHPDTDVAAAWAEMAQRTARRFPGPPMPSQPSLDLSSLSDLDESDRTSLLDALEQWMASYFDDVNTQLLAMHGELLRAQKQLAELQVEQARR